MEGCSGVASQYLQNKIEEDAFKNWDKFYKRNETRFYKDRHWTLREFQELLPSNDKESQVLLEVGCGVGNFIYPLLEENNNLFIYACDFSARAIDFIKKNPLYNPSKINAFLCDVTKDSLCSTIGESAVDVVTLIFVLSAIHPTKFGNVIANIGKCLKPDGIVLFRDYAVNDMAMLRFSKSSKLGERLYVRQDLTRAYYFTKEEVSLLFEEADFIEIENNYISRETMNRKENIKANRLFLQAKYQKANSL